MRKRGNNETSLSVIPKQRQSEDGCLPGYLLGGASPRDSQDYPILSQARISIEQRSLTLGSGGAHRRRISKHDLLTMRADHAMSPWLTLHMEQLWMSITEMQHRLHHLLESFIIGFDPPFLFTFRSHLELRTVQLMLVAF